MKKVKIDGKEYNVNTTPILLFVESERSLTLAKIVINGKKYELTINNNGKAQMK